MMHQSNNKILLSLFVLGQHVSILIESSKTQILT